MRSITSAKLTAGGVAGDDVAAALAALALDEAALPQVGMTCSRNLGGTPVNATMSRADTGAVAVRQRQSDESLDRVLALR